MRRLIATSMSAAVVLLLVAVASAQDATPSPPATFMPTPTPIPRPVAVTVLQEGPAILELFFDNIPQGQARLMRVTGLNITGARAQFLDRRVDFFPIPGDGFFALLSAGMEQNPRTYELSVTALHSDGTSTTINSEVPVITGRFIRQEVTVGPDRAGLLDPEIERGELARLESIFSAFTPDALWDANGFRLPLNSELTSTFGAFRTFNGSIPSRHTGWDMRANVGLPVMASAAGRVAFAGVLDIRGNFVVIDHGFGVFSTYSHLSQRHVTRGQAVSAGQIIGVSGETGRSGGPHLHWEMAVNGEFVDAAEFIRMWLPAPRAVDAG